MFRGEKVGSSDLFKYRYFLLFTGKSTFLCTGHLSSHTSFPLLLLLFEVEERADCLAIYLFRDATPRFPNKVLRSRKCEKKENSPEKGKKVPLNRDKHPLHFFSLKKRAGNKSPLGMCRFLCCLFGEKGCSCRKEKFETNFPFLFSASPPFLPVCLFRYLVSEKRGRKYVWADGRKKRTENNI